MNGFHPRIREGNNCDTGPNKIAKALGVSTSELFDDTPNDDAKK
jgi:hypothetical protein